MTLNISLHVLIIHNLIIKKGNEIIIGEIWVKLREINRYNYLFFYYGYHRGTIYHKFGVKLPK